MNETRIVVTNLTCDNPWVNWSMMEKLGAKLNADDLEVLLDLVNCLGKAVHCTLDAVHLLKLVRNAFGDYKQFKNAKGDIINWEYIEKLHLLQLKEGVHCANKLTQKHIDWKKDLSRSVATAIAFCRDELQLQDFAGSEATCEFLLTFNDLFDVLNSKSVRGKFLKGPLFEKTQKYWIPVLDNARKYILELCHNSNKPVVKGPRKQPFLGFVSLIDSVKLLFKEYVLHGELDYMLTFKLSQDHLEHFFNSVRAGLGRGNNPTTVQFTARFKRLLLGATNKSSYGNCLSQDHIEIMSYPVETKEAVELITSQFDLDVVDSWVDVYDRGQNLESDFKRNVCTYMSGYIHRKLESKHDCVYCEEYLKNSETKTCDLIEKKNLGGLVKPHSDIETIVNVTDCILSQKIKGTMFFGYLNFLFLNI